MKLAIVTRADENIKDITDITHPIIKKYADFCNAEFITNVTTTYELPHPHYRILGLQALLEEYDRILLIDSDIFITRECPNIFDIVPTTHVGTIFEDKGSRQDHRRSLIKAVQDKREDVGWREGYINTGVFVISKEHKIIFDEIDIDSLWLDFGFDDVELGYQINKLNIPIHELSFKFNHMSMFSEEVLGNNSRFDSYCIHFAGNGHIPFLPKYEQIKRDFILLKRHNMLFGA